MLRRRAVLATMIVVLASAQRASAQPAWDAVSPAMRGNDISTRGFGAANGLNTALVFAARPNPETGRLWLGTEDGPLVSAGGQWHTEHAPPGASIRQLRDIVFTKNHTRWFAMRSGVYRHDPTGWRHYDEAHGVPGSVSYSLVETDAIDGTPRVVVGARGGVCVIVDTLCTSVPVPDGVGRIAYMVRAAKRRGHRDDLWIASANGGVARLRDGHWSVFNAQSGLVSQSAEDLTIGADENTVFVGGLQGVFRLTRDRNGRERFEAIPGSPGAVYRVAWIPRATEPSALWVGTNDGAVLSWGAAGWDTVRFEADRIRGQVSLLQPIVEQGDTRTVYIGTRGGGLARVTFNTAHAFGIPGRAARDYVSSFAYNAWEPHRGSAVVVSLGSGANVIDSLGRVRRLGRATDTLGMSADRVYWGPLEAASRESDVGRLPSEFVILGTKGLARLVNNVWQLMPLSQDFKATTLQRLTLLDGSSVLTALSLRGVFAWQSGAWRHLATLPDQPVTAALSFSSSGSPTILLGTKGGVLTLTSAGTTFDSVAFHESLPSSSSLAASRGNVWIRQLCVVSTAHGDVVVAGGDLGTTAWRHANEHGAWKPFPVSVQRALSPSTRAEVSCDDRNRVFFGGGRGLVAVDVSSARPADWTITGVFGREDGLASNIVTAIGRPVDNRLWVGTEFGPAIVDLSRSALAPAVPLSVQVTDSNDGSPLNDDITLPLSHGNLRVDVWLDTYHRENEARFTIEFLSLSPLADAFVSRSPADTVWNSLTTRYFTGLAAGRYVLRVRGRDYAGRESAPVERRITILPPWWRSWSAIISYALLLAMVLLFAYRWRVSVLQRGTAQLIQSERRLRESEGRFRALFEGALDAHLLVEAGRVVGANAAAAALFGVESSGLLVGRPIDQLVPPTSTASAGDVTVPRTSANGTTDVPVQVTRTDIVLEGGSLQHVVLRDLTDVRAAEVARARVETHLRERQRLEALGTLAGGVAHDFNNLLGVIRGNAELADGEAAVAETTHEHLASIVDASDRARDLVRQILAFSHSPLPRQERVDVSELVRSLQPLLRRMIPTSVGIVVEGIDVAHVVFGDPAQLQQVLLNLASNAEYAMRERASGTLTIAVSEVDAPADGPPPVGDVVRLTVRDTGVGMTPEVSARVFEPFFTTKPTGEGTGLGMAVLHGVVVAHGGRVSITSQVHVGTTVDVFLPRALVVTTPSTESAAHGDGAPITSLSAARIVVVDDEPTVARVIERALSRAGHTVRVFAEPQAALQAIEAAPDSLDLLLTDQTMPVMTGDMLAEAVRNCRRDLPVLILTGFSHRLTPERAVAVGAVEILQKPIALDALHRAVDSALAGAAAAR